MHLLLRRLRNWADAAKRSFRRKAVSPKQSAICNRLSISWFGGEPLLASSIVLDVGRHAFNLCEQHGVKFGAGLTTNGYLLAPELFNELISIGHNDYQITLDGDEEWHDKTRVLANRRPTFQRIWSNLETCRSAPGKFSIMLRLHVHRENVESVKRLYDMLKASLLGDPRFTVYFHKVSNLNPGTTVKEQVLGRDEYLNALEFITGDDERPAAPAGAISEEHLSGYICYAAKPNSLMVRANGTIGKCTVALSDERNSIGRLNDDGSLFIANEKLRRWMEGFRDLSAPTLGCPLATLA